MVDGRTWPDGAIILGEQQELGWLADGVAMLRTHGISKLGVLRTDELALLFGAFDAACSQMSDYVLDPELVAKEIVAAFDRGVTSQWELANAVSRSWPACPIPAFTP